MLLPSAPAACGDAPRCPLAILLAALPSGRCGHALSPRRRGPGLADGALGPLPHPLASSPPHPYSTCSEPVPRALSAVRAVPPTHWPPQELTGVQVGSSFCSSSLSSPWQSLCLSPPRPEYSWKVHTMAATACSRGLAILTVRGHGGESQPEAQPRLGRFSEIAPSSEQPALTTPASSNFSPYDPNVIFLDRSLLS